MRAARVAPAVGDDGIPRQFRQANAFVHALQRMPARHDDAVTPSVARQVHQARIVRHGFGRHADVGLALQQHFGHLLGRALVQMQDHVWIALAELLDDGRQGVARLGMRGRDRQHPLAAVGVLGARMPDVVGALQYLFHQRQDQFTRRRQADQALAGAHEDVHAHLFLQLADLAADTGLRRMQAF
ncbi:hypothetical protein D3C72_1094690 [compost metagenome]